MCKSFLCVKAFLCKLICAQSFSVQKLPARNSFCVKELVTVTAFWRTEELRWVKKKVEHCSVEMKTVEKNLDNIREEMGREELRWSEIRSEELKRDEVRSLKRGARRVQCEGWSVIFGTQSVAWRCIATWSCAGHVLGQQQRNRFAQSKHARTGLGCTRRTQVL